MSQTVRIRNKRHIRDAIHKCACFLVDYDGLLVDTERVYFRTWCAVLSPDGRRVCKRIFAGGHESETYQVVKRFVTLRNKSLTNVSKTRATLFREFVADGTLAAMPHARRFLRELASRAPVTIVSNSPARDVIQGLQSCELNSYISAYVCWARGLRRKPAPDLYRRAVIYGGLARRDYLAFEDSISGIRSAAAAGVRVIGISADHTVWSYCRSRGLAFLPSLKQALACIGE